MDGRRTALIVASDEFEHAGLSRLQAPSADAEALAGVLGDPDIGGFEVRVVHNSPSHTVQAQVEDLFAEGRPDDLLLLHFSGHGLKSDSGELFFAATNTRPDRLASTAVSADFVQRCMRGSRARSIVLFLDCCYGGAFGEGVAVRAAGPANVLDSFPAGKLGGGRGRAVITASSAMEYAFEGSALATDEQRQPSVFTSAVVEGLSSGAADRDEDGLVSLNELYDYVFDQVRAQNPNQTPSRDIELQGELYVAKSRRKRVRAVPLPPDLRAAVQDENMYTRLGAVGELRARLASADPGVALGAREALQDVARSDTSYVAEAARDALSSAPPTQDTTSGTAPKAAPDKTTAGKAPAQPPPAFLVSPPASVPENVRPPAPPGPEKPTAAEQSPAPTAAEQSPAPAAAEQPASPAAVEQPEAPAAAEQPEAPAATEHAQAPAPAQSDEPAGSRARPTPRHRVTAGRTTLTGGALLLLSALLPEFVYDNTSVFSFKEWLGIVLLAVGAVTLAVATATLGLTRLRGWWPWPVVATGVAAAITLVLILDATADLGASDIYLGIWVALAGCLTTAAAGVIAMVGWRLGPETSKSSHPDPPTRLTRAVGTGALVASGTILAATFAVRFLWDTQALVKTNYVWAWLFPGFVGVAAGILTLRARRWPHVGPALISGAGAAAIWGLWEMPIIWSDEGTAALKSGYFLELIGLIGLVTAAVGALAALRRERGLAMTRPAWGTVTLTGLIGLAAAVPFIRVAEISWESSETSYALHDVQMAVFVVAVPVLAAMIRPGEVGRLVLLGWTLGAAGPVIAYWRLLREVQAPLLGVPYVLIALTVLAVIAVTTRSRQAD
ncbi:MAG: caspase family protein [Pedococcus sp.]